MNNTKRYNVKYAGICGSDINKVRAGDFFERDILTLGHEIVCCDELDKLYVVNPFICDDACNECNMQSLLYCSKASRLGDGKSNSGYSGMVNAPSKNLYEIPHCNHPEIGVLCDGIAVVLHGLHMVNLQNITKLAIVGAGTIGMLAAIIIKEKFPLIDIDIYCSSSKKAMYLNQLYGNLFNNKIINSVDIKRDYYDVVIEAVGGNQSETITKAIDLAVNGGSIVVFGAFGNQCTNLEGLRQLFYKQITMIGVNSYCKIHDDFDKAVSWTFAHEDLLLPLLTDLYQIDRCNIQNAYIYENVLKHKLIKGCFVYG